MKNYIANLYISKRMDTDLMGIICQVSPSVFNKITKYALRSLFDSDYIAKTKQLYYESVRADSMQINESVVLHLSLTSKKDDNIRFLLSKIKDRKRGSFIKQVVRYCLGAEIIFPIYLVQENLLKSPNYSHLVLEGLEKSRSTYKRKPSVKKQSTDNAKPSSFVKPAAVVTNALPQEETRQLPLPQEETKWEDSSFTFEENKEVPSSGDDDDDILALLNNILG